MERWKRRLLLLLHRREAAAIRRPRAVPAPSTAATAAPAPPPVPTWPGAEATAWPVDQDAAEDDRLTATAMAAGAGGGGAGAGPGIEWTEEHCLDEYRDQAPPPDDFCNFTWDGVLCWPPTRANHTARHFCPKLPDFDPSRQVLKRCGADGRWEGRNGSSYASLPQGYTDYTQCYWDEIRRLIEQLNKGPVPLEDKLAIASRTRTMEVVGLSLSLAALLVSLAIFFHFRNLRNNRTRIHKNLFIAMLMQVVIRLTLYIDKGVTPVLPPQGFVHNTPVLCEASYVLMEYARTAMFLWMFIEGLYLHNMVTVTVFQEAFYYSLYTLIGWGVPALMTVCWAVTTALKLEEDCFRNYNLRTYFWILEGPRLGVIVLNFLFLLNIIRVLVVKLRQSRTSEMEQVRKAVRAALVLLPLLGITNLTNMMPPPFAGHKWELAVWFYVTHFLTSFQGLFIACLYCFLNGEVRLAVMQRVYRYLSLRPHHFQPRRNSAFSGVYVTAEPSLGLPALPRHHTVELEVDQAPAPASAPAPAAASYVQQQSQCSGDAGLQAARAVKDRGRDQGGAPGRRPLASGALALLCCRDAPPRPSPRRPAPDGADAAAGAAGAPGGLPTSPNFKPETDMRLQYLEEAGRGGSGRGSPSGSSRGGGERCGPGRGGAGRGGGGVVPPPRPHSPFHRTRV